MKDIIKIMLGKYNPKTDKEKKNAIKEIIQEIALSGLSRTDFFEKVAFYGGTCLRMFYNLNRFSEDLDFALIDKDKTFNLSDYFEPLKKELSIYGIEVDIEKKEKDKAIQSAFMKANTLMLMMSFYPNDSDLKKIIPNEKMKIKFEIDIDNPNGASFENKYRMLPSPFEIKTFDESSLFAGKIHAIICRNYERNIKGRDYYDYLFYIGKGSSFNLKYLENKLKNTGGIISDNEVLTLEKVKQLLENKFSIMDIELAKKDVIPFIHNEEDVTFWNKELFISTLNSLKTL